MAHSKTTIKNIPESESNRVDKNVFQTNSYYEKKNLYRALNNFIDPKKLYEKIELLFFHTMKNKKLFFALFFKSCEVIKSNFSIL